MCGYAAIYTEGYAVPPSAFVLQEDGSYTAAVWARTAVLILAAGAVIFVLWRIVLLQASLRRRHFKKKISYHPDGSGTMAVYEAILRTADLVKKSKEKSDKTAVERLKTDYPEIGGCEWDSFYEQVMQAAFYYPQEGEDERVKTEQLYRRFFRAAKRRMGAGKRFLYKYIYCLDITSDVRKT